jgi:hypothetical protein
MGAVVLELDTIATWASAEVATWVEPVFIDATYQNWP